MGLKWLLGGEVNNKAIEKNYKKEMNFQESLFRNVLKNWNKSKNSIEVKIQNLIKIYEDEPEFPKLFFERYPNLVPKELNPFLNENQAVNLSLEELKLKKEILEMELKLKELENSK